VKEADTKMLWKQIDENKALVMELEKNSSSF
jgi:hypothetical protein